MGMAGSWKKNVLISLAVVVVSLLLVLRVEECRAENENKLEVRSPDVGPFSNLTVYLSFLDATYDHLSSGVNVSEKCRLESREILQRARNGDVNSLKFLDATGKPSSGILEGGVFFIGFYSECVNSVINVSSFNTSYNIEGQYCLVNLKFPSHNTQENIPEASWRVLDQSQKPPTIGICIPSSCSQAELDSSVLSSLELNFVNVKGSVSSCHRDPAGFSKDTGAICILSILMIFISISIIATATDIILDKKKSKATISNSATDHAKSLSREALCEEIEPNPPRKIVECLLAFSLKRNIKKIFIIGKSRESIQGVHGLKFFSMALIILGHTFSFATQNLYFRNPAAAVQAPKDFVSQIFANGTLAVDTFYVISGALVAYVTLKILEKTQGKLPFLFFYVHRYCRLTPLMMIVTLMSAYLLRYIGSGPNWLPSIIMYDEWCRKNAWINALYLHNFINTDNMCLSHTWYLATDMQFYLIVPLIVIPLYKSTLWGYIVSIMFLAATSLITGLLTYINHYPAIPYINNILPQSLVNDYYKNVYIKPYCRLGPYVIGILLGHFLWSKKECNMNEAKSYLGWILSCTLGLTIIYIMWPANQGYLPSDSEAAAYSSLARISWALCLSWLLFACNYGYGGFVNSILSWSPLIPLSRLTYCAYLIHPIVMNAFYGSLQFVVDFSTPFVMYLFLGNICFTFFLSIFLSAMFESPFIVLEKVLLSKKS